MKLFYGQVFPEVKINEDEQQHLIKVLRLKEGEEIFITDGKGNLTKGNLFFEGKKVHLQVKEIQENLPDFPRKLHLAIAPTKNIDRTEFFLEKAVEMGVSEITFLLTENSERKNINLERLKKQAISASKQSLRFHFPIINSLTKLTDFLPHISPENTFVAHCHSHLERKTLQDAESLLDTTFLIGPEGDFSEKEVGILSEKGIKAVSLGNQRLRTETAGIFLAAWNYEKM